MESRFHHRLPQPQNQQNQINSGLIRYRSAPSSYFTNLMDRELCEQFFSRPSSLEPEHNFTAFPSSGINVTESVQNLSAIQWTSLVSDAEAINNQLETNVNNYFSASPHFFHNPSKPLLPNQSQSLNSGLEEDYWTGTGRFPNLRTGSRRMSNLIRHSSLPTGLLSDVNIQTGLSAIRGIASYGGADENNEVEPSFPTAGRSKSTSFGPMFSIAELEDKPGVPTEDFSQGHLSGFENSPWDDIPADQSNNITSIKGFEEEEEDDDEKLYSNFSSSETQIVDAGNYPPRLTHQLSLPNTSAEMNAIENFLQLSDSVPCKVRAKRGCATHPRSIAERIRRTRISERMKKLQDLVPNMEKQTNTADMLELAVEYIKELQKQVQTLDHNRAKCRCSR